VPLLPASFLHPISLPEAEQVSRRCKTPSKAVVDSFTVQIPSTGATKR
jgi:hypothetical protein